MTNRFAQVPAWRSVAVALQRQIAEGSLPPGSRLPSLQDLVQSTGLSLHGARRAMGYLCDAGCVMSWQGRGYFVAEETFIYRIHSGTQFGANLHGEGKSYETRLLDTRTVRAPTEVAHSFGLRRGALVRCAELLRLVERSPAILARHYYTVGRFAAVTDQLAATGSVSAAFRLLGLPDFHRRETLISTRLPSTFEALCLDIPPSQPIIVARGVNVDKRDQVVEVSESLSRGDRVRFQA